MTLSFLREGLFTVLNCGGKKGGPPRPRKGSGLIFGNGKGQLTEISNKEPALLGGGEREDWREVPPVSVDVGQWRLSFFTGRGYYQKKRSF